MMNHLVNALKREMGSMDASGGQHRMGTISSYDPVNGAVKVILQPEGVETGWLPLGGVAANGVGLVVGPSSGDQVIMAPTEGAAEEMVIVARVFDAVGLPPRSAATGNPVQSGEVGMFGSGGQLIHMTGSSIFINSGTIHFSGTTQVTGNLTVTGNITATGDVRANA